uniref:Uncharacterized protein n=1 Tax=Arundo donax TaxID=35708 RepID=A0A0A9DGU2_ARUDO
MSISRRICNYCLSSKRCSSIQIRFCACR